MSVKLVYHNVCYTVYRACVQKCLLSSSWFILHSAGHVFRSTCWKNQEYALKHIMKGVTMCSTICLRGPLLSFAMLYIFSSLQITTTSTKYVTSSLFHFMFWNWILRHCLNFLTFQDKSYFYFYLHCVKDSFVIIIIFLIHFLLFFYMYFFMYFLLYLFI